MKKIPFFVARCHTNLSMDTFLSEPTAHNHAPVPDRVPVIELCNKVKARAATSEESTSTILHSVLRTFPLSAATELPRTEMILQTIRRQRTTPATKSDDVIPDELRKTDRGEDFLLFEDKEMIIFTTKSNLSALKQSKHWFADGTFKVCVPINFQININFSLSLGVSKRLLSIIHTSRADDIDYNSTRIRSVDWKNCRRLLRVF